MKPAQDELDSLEESLKKLRTAYEKYFAGVERLEPIKERGELKTIIRRLFTQHNNNTAWRFRVQTLQASLITHESYWDRITRQIEEGTYRRDLMRMQRKQGEEVDATEARSDAVAEPSAAATPAKPPAAASKPEVSVPPLSAADAAKYPPAIRKLYETYARARAQAGEPQVSIEMVATTVRKQMQAIKEQYKCETVEFKIGVRDGKTVLKAVPK